MVWGAQFEISRSQIHEAFWATGHKGCTITPFHMALGVGQIICQRGCYEAHVTFPALTSSLCHLNGSSPGFNVGAF